MAQHNDLGKIGEVLAVDHLKQLGFTIKATNWFFGRAEIDIIAKKGDLLVAVEVKTRTSDFFGAPEIFVNKKKIALIGKAMHHYVIRNALEVEVRFDIITVLKNKYECKINHIENAFYYL